jgi:hypothetical protein
MYRDRLDGKALIYDISFYGDRRCAARGIGVHEILSGFLGGS